jgi:hypothetical protein
MVSKTREHHFLLAFIEAIPIITMFDLWMSCERFYIFSLVINYINQKWESCHIIIYIFWVHETSKIAMVVQLKYLFARYDLLNKVMTYTKDKKGKFKHLHNCLNKHYVMCSSYVAINIYCQLLWA